LITGADGFAGQHLLRELLSNASNASVGLEIHGTTFRALADTTIPYHILDLRDAPAVSYLIGTLQPDQVYHLAGTARVGQSYDAAWSTLENNIRAQLNLILACLEHDLKPRLLVVSSGDIYGDKLIDAPATEDTPLCPMNPYAVSKVAQDMLALQYCLSHDLPVVRARPFNHLGPGQSRGFVAPDFAYQIARIEAGQQEPRLHIGSLSAERDFTDVRDVVRAYRLLMERGTPGAVYNIASGTARPVRFLLETMLSYSTIQPVVDTDTARLRPGKISKVWGDATRLKLATGWQPTIPIEQTLLDVLEDYRQRVRAIREEST
jgi:GDP-4-dehydro-6-deoxy-D-mannose reductase